MPQKSGARWGMASRRRDGRGRRRGTGRGPSTAVSRREGAEPGRRDGHGAARACASATGGERGGRGRGRASVIDRGTDARVVGRKTRRRRRRRRSPRHALDREGRTRRRTTGMPNDDDARRDADVASPRRDRHLGRPFARATGIATPSVRDPSSPRPTRAARRRGRRWSDGHPPRPPEREARWRGGVGEREGEGDARPRPRPRRERRDVRPSRRRVRARRRPQVWTATTRHAAPGRDGVTRWNLCDILDGNLCDIGSVWGPLWRCDSARPDLTSSWSLITNSARGARRCRRSRLLGFRKFFSLSGRAELILRGLAAASQPAQRDARRGSSERRRLEAHPHALVGPTPANAGATRTRRVGSRRRRVGIGF